MFATLHNGFVKNMPNKKTLIPWESEDAWPQVVLSISKSISAISEEGSEIARIRMLVEQVVQDYAKLETILERICSKSCSSCVDVCCSKATVWYDLKDLLVIYFNRGALPDKQIYKRPGSTCCNLTPSGCRLIRSDRPFICTWYICPDQKSIIAGFPNSTEQVALYHAIDKIKTNRKDLETLYISAIFR